MEDAKKAHGNADVCGLCQQPFSEGETLEALLPILRNAVRLPDGNVRRQVR